MRTESTIQTWSWKYQKKNQSFYSYHDLFIFSEVSSWLNLYNLSFLIILLKYLNINPIFIFILICRTENTSVCEDNWNKSVLIHVGSNTELVPISFKPVLSCIHIWYQLQVLSNTGCPTKWTVCGRSS